MGDLDSVPTPAPGLFVRELDGETSIITSEGDQLHTLDEVGTFIWRCIDGRTPLSAILEAICAEFDAPREVAAADLRQFVGQLAERGIVTLA